jgi:omega-6 fatty acid desaturase (delta-12 desaturase)
MVQLPISLLGGAAGIWLFYIQHQFEDTYWREHEEWNFHKAGIEGSSFYDLPAVVTWFTGNIGYHHIHHLASRVPNYSLRKCYREIAPLHEVTRMTFRGSLKCARLKLWDEESDKLIAFRDLRLITAPSKA